MIIQPESRSIIPMQCVWARVGQVHRVHPRTCPNRCSDPQSSITCTISDWPAREVGERNGVSEEWGGQGEGGRRGGGLTRHFTLGSIRVSEHAVSDM